MLDIGCAFGFLLKRVAPYFNEIHGIDISDYAIQRAKKEAPTAKLKVININRGKLPYPDKYFDLIAAIDVLEHTESIEKSLRKIKRILRHNGYLIISVPLKDTLAGKIHNILNRDLSHFCILSRKELFDIIDRVGFKVLEKSYFFNMIFFKLKGIPVFIEVILQKK